MHRGGDLLVPPSNNPNHFAGQPNPFADHAAARSNGGTGAVGVDTDKFCLHDSSNNSGPESGKGGSTGSTGSTGDCDSSDNSGPPVAAATADPGLAAAHAAVLSDPTAFVARQHTALGAGIPPSAGAGIDHAALYAAATAAHAAHAAPNYFGLAQAQAAGQTAANTMATGSAPPSAGAAAAASTFEFAQQMAAALLQQQRQQMLQQPQQWATPGLPLPGQIPGFPNVSGGCPNFGFQQTSLQMLQFMQAQQQVQQQAQLMASQMTAAAASDAAAQAVADRAASSNPAQGTCREFCIRDLVPRLGQTPGASITFVIDMTDDQIVKGAQTIEAQLSSDGGQAWKQLSANPCTAPHGSPLVLQTKIMSQVQPGNYILRLHVNATNTSTQALPFEIKPNRKRQRAQGQSRRFARKRKHDGKHDGKAPHQHIAHVQQTVPDASSGSEWSNAVDNASDSCSTTSSARPLAKHGSPMLVTGHEVEFMIQMVKPGALQQLTNDGGMTASGRDLVLRLVNRTLRGKFCYKRDGTMGFQSSECVLVNCAHERRSATRLDLPRSGRGKVMLHALAYTLWCDPNFNYEDWRSLKRGHHCMYGHSGGDGNSGWAHNKYSCVNPFHYQPGGTSTPTASKRSISTTNDLTLHKHEHFRLHQAPPNPEMFIQLNGDKTFLKDDSKSSSGNGSHRMGHTIGCGNGSHEPDEFRWLCNAHQKFALVGIDDKRCAPDEVDVIKRLIEKVQHGTFTKKVGDKISFEREKCVLVVSPREARSSVRIDIVNFASKCWPQALTYRLFRDPYFQLKEWQNLRKIDCCNHGYAGPKCGGSGGWPTENYICVNPYHYEVYNSGASGKPPAAAVAAVPANGPETSEANSDSGKAGSSDAGHRESLSSVLVGLLLDDSSAVLLERGQKLFVAEDVVDKVYVVVNGGLRLTRGDHSLALRKMDMLGSLVDDPLPAAPCGYSAVATTSTTVCAIDPNHRAAICVQFPAMLPMVRAMRSKLRSKLKFGAAGKAPDHMTKKHLAAAEPEATTACANADTAAVAGVLCEMGSAAGPSK